MTRAKIGAQERATWHSIPQFRRTQTENDPNAGNLAGSEGPQRESVYWPADLACATLPESRILTYGYDTKIRHWIKGPVSQKTVYDHAWDLLCSLEALRRSPNERRRPILFIAHSLGGIIVKEALRRSQGCMPPQAHLCSVIEAVVGVVFFGTPHSGADPRNFLHHILSASAQALGIQVNKRIVEMLMPNSERLKSLTNEFSGMCRKRKWHVFSFQEEYGVLGLFNTKVVDDQSSCLGDPTIETKQHISRNHMDMCRFSGLRDPEYLKVAAAMALILGTIKRGAEAVDADELPARGQMAGNTPRPPAVVPPRSPFGAPRQQALPSTKAALISAEVTDVLEITNCATPCQDFVLFMDRLSGRAHADIADVADPMDIVDIIFSNCKAACFGFYQLHRLYRAQFGDGDSWKDQKLFQLSKSKPPAPDRFPQTPDDLDLEDWIAKLTRVFARINKTDTVYSTEVYDLSYWGRIFGHVTKIPHLVDSWGEVRIEVMEEYLIYSIALCQVLGRWHCRGRLRDLWLAIHRPELPFINKARLMPPSLAKRPERDGDSEVGEEDSRASKRVRVEE